MDVITKKLRLHCNENLFVNQRWLNNLVCEALKGTSINYYPDMFAEKLRKKIAKHYHIPTTCVFIGNGADGVLSNLFSIFRSKYNTVTSLSPGYLYYNLFAKRFNYDIKRVSPSQLSHYLGGLFVLDSPNSITGEILSPHLLEEIADSNSTLIWDNVYGEFSDDDIYPLIDKKAIIVRSFSKYYGIPGIRVGYCIVPPEIIQKLDQHKDIFNVNLHGQAIAFHLLENIEYFNELKNQALQAKKAFIKELKNLGFEISDSRGNFLFIDHPNLSSEKIRTKLERSEIYVRNYTQYGATLNGIRITIPPINDQPIVLKALDDIL